MPRREVSGRWFTDHDQVSAAAVRQMLDGAKAEELLKEQRRLAACNVVAAACEWYEASHKDEPEHRLALTVMHYKAAMARTRPE